MEGVSPFCSSAYMDITMPGVQKPHCREGDLHVRIRNSYFRIRNSCCRIRNSYFRIRNLYVLARTRLLGWQERGVLGSGLGLGGQGEVRFMSAGGLWEEEDREEKRRGGK